MATGDIPIATAEDVPVLARLTLASTVPGTHGRIYWPVGRRRKLALTCPLASKPRLLRIPDGGHRAARPLHSAHVERASASSKRQMRPLDHVLAIVIAGG